MPTILEVDDTGSLRVPIASLLKTTPHAKFSAQAHGNSIVIEPLQKQSEPFWKQATPQERAADILAWAREHRDGPGLPDSAIGRDSIYD